MTETATAFTRRKDSREAGRDLALQAMQAFAGEPPDALVVFASSRYDYATLLGAIQETAQPRVLVGCSSAGEFTRRDAGEGAASAVALRSDTIAFSASLGRGLRQDFRQAAAEAVASFSGLRTEAYPWRAALVLLDPLSGHGEELVQELTLLTGARYQFFGGGAGDDGKFEATHVFCGTEAATDAVVALEILSKKPIGIGSAHGWQPASTPMRVTASQGLRLHSLNAIPAVDVYEDFADSARQMFEREQPLPFFLHHIIGVHTREGDYRLRVPLLTHADGSITCAAEVPCSSTVSVMKASTSSAAEAAQRATREALHNLHGATPKAALFFDCVATRLRMGKDFGMELDVLREELRDTHFAGFNTYGQIVRKEGQFGGFHNCTAVVCVLSD